MILWGYGITPTTSQANASPPSSATPLSAAHGLVAGCSEMQFSQVLLSCGSGTTAARALNSVLANLDAHTVDSSGLPAHHLQSPCAPILAAPLTQFNLSQLHQLNAGANTAQAAAGSTGFQQLHPILLPSTEQWAAEAERRCKPWVYIDLFKANSEQLMTSASTDGSQLKKLAAGPTTADVVEHLQLNQLVSAHTGQPLVSVACPTATTTSASAAHQDALGHQLAPQCQFPSDAIAQTQSVNSPQSTGTPSSLPPTPQPPPSGGGAGYSTDSSSETTTCSKSLCPLASNTLHCCGQPIVGGNGGAGGGAPVGCGLTGSICCDEIHCSKQCSALECNASTPGTGASTQPVAAFPLSVTHPHHHQVASSGPHCPGHFLTQTSASTNASAAPASQQGFIAASPAGSSVASRSVCGTPTPSVVSTCSELSTRSRAGSTARSDDSGHHDRGVIVALGGERRRPSPDAHESDASAAATAKKRQRRTQQSRKSSDESTDPAVVTEQLKAKRLKQATKARLARLRETPEQRKRRLEKLAAYAAARRAKETPEQRETRLQDMRERAKERNRRKKLQQQIRDATNRMSGDTTPVDVHESSPRSRMPKAEFPSTNERGSRGRHGQQLLSVAEIKAERLKVTSEQETPPNRNQMNANSVTTNPVVVPSLQQLVTVLAGGVTGVDPAFTVTQVTARVASGSTTLSTRVARLRPILPKPTQTSKTDPLNLKGASTVSPTTGSSQGTPMNATLAGQLIPSPSTAPHHIGYPTPSTLSSCSSPAQSQLSDFDIPSPPSMSDRSTPMDFSPPSAHAPSSSGRELEPAGSRQSGSSTISTPKSLVRSPRTIEGVHKECLGVSPSASMSADEGHFTPNGKTYISDLPEFAQRRSSRSSGPSPEEFLTTRPTAAEFPIDQGNIQTLDPSPPSSGGQQSVTHAQPHVNLDELRYTPLRDVMTQAVDTESSPRGVCLREGLQTPPPSECTDEAQQLSQPQILSSHSHSVHALNFQPSSSQMDAAPGFESLLCPTPGPPEHHHGPPQSQGQQAQGSNILQNAIILSQLY